MPILTTRTQNKALAAGAIETVLKMRRSFGSTDPCFLKFSNANPFWENNFSGTQLANGEYKIPAEKSELELGLLAERVQENLASDFDAYAERNEHFRPKATGSTITTVDGDEIEVDELLTFYRKWGKDTAGLIELYSVGDENTIHLHFESRAGLPSRRTEVENTGSGVLAIYECILERQDEIVEATRKSIALPRIILQTTKAYQAGLPQNYQTRFSYRAEDLIDCFVLTTDGVQRAPDQIYDSDGVLQPCAFDMQSIALTGTKIWRQILLNELVVKIHRSHIDNESEDSCDQYTFEIVVCPFQPTEAQLSHLKTLAESLYSIAGERLPSKQYWHWEANCTSSFAVSAHSGKILPDTLSYYMPKYYYDKNGDIVSLDDEEIAASVSKSPIGMTNQHDDSVEHSEQADEISAAIEHEFHNGE